MLLFAIIMFLPTRQLSRQKLIFFPSHFTSISSCSACLVGIIWGKHTVLYLENEPKYHFNNKNTRNRRSKTAQNVEVSLTSRAEKTLRHSAISDVSSSIAGR